MGAATAGGMEGRLERTEARGRNGWIKARRYKVYAFSACPEADGSQGPVVWLDLWSGRPARTAPVQIKMSTEEARRLALAIGLAAEEVEWKEAGDRRWAEAPDWQKQGLCPPNHWAAGPL